MKLFLVQLNRTLKEIEVIEITGIKPSKTYPDCMEVFFDEPGVKGLTKKEDIIHIYSEA